MARRSPPELDAVVIGAGISGLVAARELRRRGASVRVLEARERVGGRIHTVWLEGCPIDLGAHWIGPSQRRIAWLVGELGIESEPQHLEGEHVVTLGGRPYRFRGATPLTSPLGVAETALAVARLELRRRLIDAQEPWRSRGAARLDSLTLGRWMDGLRSRTARATFRIVARTVFGAEPSELSLLYFLWYSRAAGGYRALTEFEGAAQDSRLAGGAQQLCERLAADLGDAVVTASPVRSVEQDGDAAVVRSDKLEATCRRVVAGSPLRSQRESTSTRLCRRRGRPSGSAWPWGPT